MGTHSRTGRGGSRAAKGSSRPTRPTPATAKGSSRPATRTTRASRQPDAPSRRASFAEAFAGLVEILAPYRDDFDALVDQPDNLILVTRRPYEGKPLYFAGTTSRRSYVSYYLVPIYMFPEVARGMSPALAQRRQGKSCFNFTARDELLFAELAKLTERGFKELRKRKLL